MPGVDGHASWGVELVAVDVTVAESEVSPVTCAPDVMASGDCMVAELAVVGGEVAAVIVVTSVTYAPANLKE